MITIDEAVKKEYEKYQGKVGRPKGRDKDMKKYERLSISLTKQQKQAIQKYADRKYDGNISIAIREILKQHKVIK